MSEVVEKAIGALKEKLGDQTLPSSAKFVIRGEGSVRVDSTGVSADDSEADVTLTADLDTFEGIITGNMNPTTAFMTGKLKIEGDMGVAMKLGALLA
ncbi:MAG TPA: SCP2 sterol-binding domain-containing protein [Paracoccaceae bacterium]|nr:SCP2 sterol-binding domain-containing protein [Paracoccaceae bacterium]